MAFCLVCIMGLLPVGLRQERTSSEQLLALQLLSATASDFRASETSQDLSKGSANTIRYAIKIPQIGGAPETGSFFASENFEKLDTPSGGAFQVQYTVKPPLTRLSGYQLHLFVSWNPNAKTPYTLTTLRDKDFVETVVTRTL